MRTTYVFGHKKPDTDSVCAAISYAYLKNKLGLKAEPRVLGPINKETKYALDYFNVEEPKYLNDVKVQIKDMEYLKNSEKVYLELADIYNFYVINCIKDKNIRSIDDINSELFDFVIKNNIIIE